MHKAYDTVRTKIIEAERISATGGNIWLSPKELKANTILMTAKKQEVYFSLYNNLGIINVL